MSDLSRQQQPLGRRPALVLVDVSNGFTDPASPLGSECDAVVAACAELLSGFRSRGLPVCFTTVAYSEAQQASVFRSRLPALDSLEMGAEPVEIDRRVAPVADERLVVKQYASAFFETDLQDWLIEVNADSLVVCGLTTSGCVRATVVDGLQHDYSVWVAREAVGDRNADAHQANLHDMHAKYAEVVSLAEVLAEIDRSAELVA